MRNRFGIPSSLAARAERFGLRDREPTDAVQAVQPHGRLRVSSKRGLQVGVRVHPIAPARDPGSEQP